MNERNRHRVTGSVFLVAVAFIVLPMIFDGGGLAPVEIEPMEPHAVWDVVTRLPEQPAAAPAAVAGARALRDAVDHDGFMAATGSRLGEPVLTRPPAESGSAPRAQHGPAWAVQLASFSDRANAVALRDRLRSDGFQAVLSDARQGSVASTRVAIGPIVSRDEALKLQRELSDRYQLSPIVVAFSP